MEDNNKTDISNIELLNDLKNISSSDSKPHEIIKSRSSLAMQMEGLNFEEQKEMLNKMTANRTINRYNEHVGKRYSLEDIKNLNISVDESVKILLNEAVLAQRMDMKSVTLMVNDFHKSKIEKTEPANIVEKAIVRKTARI